MCHRVTVPLMFIVYGYVCSNKAKVFAKKLRYYIPNLLTVMCHRVTVPLMFIVYGYVCSNKAKVFAKKLRYYIPNLLTVMYQGRRPIVLEKS